MAMMAVSSGRSENEEDFSDMTARRKLAASLALGKQVEGRREHGLLSTWRKRRELGGREREHDHGSCGLMCLCWAPKTLLHWFLKERNYVGFFFLQI